MLGGGRALPVVHAGSRARQAGSGTGPGARLDRRAAAGTACMAVGGALTWQGRLEEAEPWDPARRAHCQGRNRACDAAGGPLPSRDARAGARPRRRCPGRIRWRRAAGQPPRQAEPAPPTGADHAAACLVRLGDTERAEQALADLIEHDRNRGETRIATALLRLAQHDPHAALDAIAPVLDGPGSALPGAWLAYAFWLEAIARDALGDEDAAGRALERSLDLSEPDGAVWWFLLHPVSGLLERHAGHRTAHAALIAEIRSLLAGTRTASPPAWPKPPEPLSASELRVLRYLPTNRRHRKSPASCRSQPTPPRPTSATYTPSSALTTVPRPSSMPAR